MSAAQPEHSNAQQSTEASAADGRNSPATEIVGTTVNRCCECSASNRCEVEKCPCVGKNAACFDCAPCGANKCENNDPGRYKDGRSKRAVRTTPVATSAAAAAANATSPAKPRRQRSSGATAAAAASSAGNSSSIEEKTAPCVEKVRQLCDSVNNSGNAAAAGVPPLTWDQFQSVEKLHKEFLRVHADSIRYREQFKKANMAAASAEATLNKYVRENTVLTKKFNEVTAKLKLAEGSKIQNNAGKQSNKRAREPNSGELHRGGRDDAAAPSITARISNSDDSQRQRIQHSTVHPDRRNLVPQDRNTNSAGNQRPHRALDTMIIIPAEQCLVASNVRVRLHTPNPEVLHRVNQLLVNLELVHEADSGSTTAIDIFALPERPQSYGPIQWKVVFKSAEAAAKVLGRNMRTPNSNIMLRAFLDRSQYQRQAEQDAMNDRGNTPRVTQLGQLQQSDAAAVQVPLTRAISSDSVICVPTQSQPTPAPPLKKEGAPLQFTTRHTAVSQQLPSPIANQLPSAATEPQQTHLRQPVVQQCHSTAAAAACSHSCDHYHSAHSQPMAPMYHSGGPAYGPFMRMPPPPPLHQPYFGPPMGYAAHGAYTAAYHGCPSQF